MPHALRGAKVGEHRRRGSPPCRCHVRFGRRPALRLVLPDRAIHFARACSSQSCSLRRAGARESRRTMPTPVGRVPRRARREAKAAVRAERSRNRETLAHAARERPHQASGSRCKPAGVERSCHTGAQIVEAVQLSKEIEIFVRAQLVIKKGAVANDADEVAAHSSDFGAAPRKKSQFAARRSHQLRGHPQQSRLPCSVCSEQRHKLSATNRQRDISRSDERAKPLLDTLKCNSDGISSRRRVRKVGSWRAVRPRRSAQPLNKIAERCIDALSLAGIILFGDGASLPPQFQTKQAILQFVKAAAHFAINFRSNRCGRRRRRCRRWLWRLSWEPAFHRHSSHRAAASRSRPSAGARSR